MAGHRAAGLRFRTLSELIDRQPKTLAKDERFAILARCLREEPSLRRARLDARGFRALDKARVEPSHLDEFLRVRRFPRSLFFPTFLALKRDYLENRFLFKRRREAYIARTLRGLPLPVRRFLARLGTIETALNGAGAAPVWSAVVVPRTKKAADSYRSYAFEEWSALAEAFGRALVLRYPRAPALPWRRLTAACMLGCFPSFDAETAARRFRSLAREHHPDAGGDGSTFRLLSAARDALSSGHPPLD